MTRMRLGEDFELSKRVSLLFASQGDFERTKLAGSTHVDSSGSHQRNA